MGETNSSRGGLRAFNAVLLRREGRNGNRHTTYPPTTHLDPGMSLVDGVEDVPAEIESFFSILLFLFQLKYSFVSLLSRLCGDGDGF